MASLNNTQWDRQMEMGINNWYYGGSTWWERRKLARLHSENKTYGGQSGMVWSVRILDTFFLFSSVCLFLFWIASCSLFHHHHSKERVGWEEIPLMSGHVYYWLLGFVLKPLHVIVYAHSLPHHLALDRLCLFLFNKWGEGGARSCRAHVC